MIRFFLAKLLARRFVFPLVLLTSFLIIGIYEYTYRTSVGVLRSGIALTEERVLASRVLQSLTDAETAERGYLLTQDALFLASYQKALTELTALRASVAPFFITRGGATGAEINSIIDSHLKEMSATISLVNSGSAQQAMDRVKSGADSQQTAALRQAFDRQLKSAADRQAVVRISLQEILSFNHVVVLLLTLSSVVALCVFIRQLRLQIESKQLVHSQLEQTVEKRTLELRELAKHLQTVREAEKDHLARELHDQLGALLTVAKLDLEGLRKRVEQTPDVTARLERLESRLNQVIVLKRQMVEDMRPSALTMLGLRSTLEQHCRDMADAMNLCFHVNIDDVSLPAETELIMFRFVQEALTNMAKYSNATNVTVSLRKDGHRIDLSVSDDGVGFDPDLALIGHHGLTGMRYRINSLGGIMTLKTEPGKGTTMQATIDV